MVGGARVSSWGALQAELDTWKSLGRIATFWWRDDDLNEPTDAFDHLLQMRKYLDIPLTLAVVPDNVDPHIADDLEGCELVQHGVTHQSYTKAGDKKSEFPEERSLAEMIAELEHGKSRMVDLFADDFFPFLVPPWNRISDNCLKELPALGFVGVSRFNPRVKAAPFTNFAEVNTHVDPVNWRGNRSSFEEAQILDVVVGHLHDRRQGRVDPMEPTGYLTHHLMFDAALWEISFKLLSFLCRHDAVRFLTLRGSISLIEEITDPDDCL